MAVAFAAYVDGTASSDSATAAVDLSGRSAGELALVIISRVDVGAPGPTSTPSGWALLQSTSYSNWVCWVYCKVLAAGDIGTVTWTWAASGRTLAHAAVYSGHDTTSPVDTSAAGTMASAVTAVDCGSLSTSEAMVVALCSCYSTQVRSYEALEGWTERRDHGSTTPDFYQLIADTNGAWGGGTCQPAFAVDYTSSYVVGFLVAIKSAGEGPTPPASTAIMTTNRGIW